MPNVPYNPVPGVRDLGRPIYPGTGAGPIHVSTPDIGPEAFGYGVGAALSHFGTVAESTGGELFSRAEAFKKLDNSNDANNAAIDTEKAQTELMEQLKMKEGKNAVDAYKDFPDQLETIRQQHRARLTNPDAQREFDNITRNNQNRMFAQGASYAGTQHKTWTDATNKAGLANAMDNVSLLPADRAQFDNMLAEVEKKDREFYGTAVDGEGKGWSEEALQAKIKEDKSTAINFALKKLGRVDPTTAISYLKKFQTDGMIQPGDVADAENAIKNPHGYQTLTRGTMADIETGRVDYFGQHKVSIERARDAIGGYESDNNYKSHPSLVSYPKGHPEGCRSLGRYQVMDCFLNDYLKEAGMEKMTPEEFLNSQAAQDQLFTKVFQQRMDKFGNFDDAASSWLTGRSAAEGRASGAKDALGTGVDRYLANTHARLAHSASAVELNDAVQQHGKVLDPNGDFPLLPTYLEDAAKHMVEHNNQVKREINYDNWSTVLSSVNKVDQDGKLQQNWDKLMSDPAVARAWPKLTDPQRQNIMDHLRVNIDRGYEETEAKKKRYDELNGMLDTAEGKSKFQSEVDLTAEKLPNKWADALMKKFHANKARWGQDEPTVRHINEAYGPLMQSAGISRTKTPDDYYSFLSAVQGAWDAHTEQYGKPPSPQEKQAIGAQILQEKAARGLSGYFGGKERMFQVIPDEYKDQIEKELTVQYGAPPDQHQIERAYFNQLYNALFQQARGKTDKAVQAVSPGPVVPASK